MILIALGSNLPGPWGSTPARTLQRAVGEIALLPGLALGAMSPWYRSRPEPPSGQPDYVNGVVALLGTLAPDALLASLQAIEQAAGRVRSVANAARTLDLDIIDMDGLVRDAPDPVLPHPRAHARGFVLLPLADIAPGWVEPRLGLELRQLIARLAPDGGCEKLVAALD